jgi:hypothetical protein
LNLFPCTLNDLALRWFISLQGNSIDTWEEMKETFMERYGDYCKFKDIKEEIFRMTKEKNETLKDFEEIFQLSYKTFHTCTLDEYSLKIVLFRGVREEYLDPLNLLAHGDISHLTYEDIKKIFKNY